MAVTTVSTPDATLLLRNLLQEAICVLEAFDRGARMTSYRESVGIFNRVLGQVSRMPMLLGRWEVMCTTEEEALEYHQALLITAWLKDPRYRSYLTALSNPDAWLEELNSWVETMRSAMDGTASPDQRRLLGLTILPVLHQLSANAVLTNKSAHDLTREIIHARNTAP